MASRLSLIVIAVYIAFTAITTRLFFWQVISRNRLQAEASAQRAQAQVINSDRGKILSSDGYALVTNQPDYVLYAYKPQLSQDPLLISQTLAPLLIDPQPRDATEAATPVKQRISQAQSHLYHQLTDTSAKWVPLWRHLNHQTKEAVAVAEFSGLGFDQYTVRHYPEASMSAHILGFVGRDESGEPKGYFGLEGYYDLEIRGKQGLIQREKDATGNPILIGLFQKNPERSGRHLQTHIDRQVQYLAQTSLEKALIQYGASAGEIVVMNPQNGAVLAMATSPGYHPQYFSEYQPGLYKNPIIANSYEPGSTFKTFVMAAALEEGLIQPDTPCDSTCDGPVTIGKYTIRTWNDQYYPGHNMQQVLERSDNTGMIFVANLLGKDTLKQYLHAFGFGQLTKIDLQEESSPSIRSKWGDIDLATISFGQGIAVTGIQMVTAISAIANGGTLYQPQVVDSVIADVKADIAPVQVRQAISPETAQQLTQMLIASAHHGEAQWAVLKQYTVAGKTGTAQIPLAGHYDKDKTIASFIGFAPAHDPKFAMLVKLREPQTSPWAAETAAPLWFDLAHQLLLYYNVPPKTTN